MSRQSTLAQSFSLPHATHPGCILPQDEVHQDSFHTPFDFDMAQSQFISHHSLMENGFGNAFQDGLIHQTPVSYQSVADIPLQQANISKDHKKGTVARRRRLYKKNASLSHSASISSNSSQFSPAAPDTYSFSQSST